MRYLLAVTLLFGMPAFGQVDPKIHKICLEAKDYQGCVSSHINYKEQSQNTKTIRVVEGEREVTGNTCPNNFAYSGAGTCTNVICVHLYKGNDPNLGGKLWECEGDGFTRPELHWGDQTIKAAYDPACPKEPPGIGWRNSCEQKEFVSTKNK